MSKQLERRMGNDKQIKKDLTKAGARFLPEEITNVDGSSDVYSLENEFEKTRKNKNWAVLIIVLVFFSIIASITALFTYYTELKNSSIDVNISEFDDVRLKEVLGAARMTDNVILIRKNELEALIIEMRNALLNVNTKYLAQYTSVLDKGLPPDVTKQQLSDLKRGEEAELAGIRADYEKKISTQRGIIGEIEKERREAERRLKLEADNLAKIGDENKAYEIKMKSLSSSQQSGFEAQRNYYERYIRYLTLKYNPVFSSRDSKELLERSGSVPADKGGLRAYDELFAYENVWSRKRFDDLRGKINDLDGLLGRIRGVDYTNSVPPAIKGIDNLYRSIVSEYENLWYGLAAAVKNKNSQIEDYRVALDAVLKERPESGYIISAKNPAAVSIHINRLIPVKDGDSGLVFRSDDDFIGRVDFYKAADGFRAKVVSLEAGKTMRPFDRILINVK